ncbi:MAG: penicillin-binding protein 2 [Solirubrobacteraceae bacterium]|nr:penicillin-binding protein 2 [Solirubrobacteraceae bacterium]
MDGTLSQRRIGLLFLIFCVLFAFAAGRAAWLGVVQADELKAAAVTQQRAQVDVPAHRGTITDRRGVELAVSQPASDVSATPYLVKDPNGVAEKLAPLIERPQGEILRKLTERGKGFVYLARKVPAARAQKVERLEIEGIDATPTSRREYPRDWLASQVLGTVGADGEGLSGLEYRYEDKLRGRDGQRSVVRDATGEAITIRDPRRALAGSDLQLTLDAGIQNRVEEILGEIGQKYRPKGATAVVMDPHSGDVLALGNWPKVNANDVGGAPPTARQNRATGFVYEPGSTFKPFTVAAALEEREVTEDTMFNLPPQIQVADRTIGESHPRGYVSLTTSGILAQSSNVGTIMIGQRLGAKKFDQWVRRFGFGRPTGIDLPGEEGGIVLPLDKYSGSSMGNLPIGQGESVTPIQLASAYSAIANGGVLRTPRLIDKANGKAVRPTPGKRVISEQTSKEVRDMLKGVVAAGGTASEVEIEGYTLAGKTGTANKVDAETGTYSKSRYIASFAGFAPADNPELLITVMVDEPGGGNIYGGEVAAPAFEDIARFALPYLGIAPK